jgi:radical SAM-linked protein
MGPALPLGYESVCELADIVLESMLSPHVLHERLAAALPTGLDLLETGWAPQAPRLSDATSASYVVELPEGPISEGAGRLTSEFMSKDSALVERVREDESKIVDVRHFVRDLGSKLEDGSVRLHMEISLGQEGTCSPSEVAQALFGMSPDAAKRLRVKRTEIRFNGTPHR